jgi:membrane protease YdiL (CAAX protease family)
MEKKKSFRTASLFSFLYLLCFYLAMLLLPILSWVGENQRNYLLILCGALLVLFGLALWERLRNRPAKAKSGHLSFWLLLPFLPLTATNLFYLWAVHAPFTAPAAIDIVFLNIISLILKVGIEEILFRGFLLAFFLDLFAAKKQGPFLAVFLTALCFSLSHAVNFYGNDPISVTAQLGYTFALGIALGAVSYGYSSLTLASIGHVLFNLFNLYLTVTCYSLQVSVPYFILSGVLAAAGIGYALILVRWKERKENNAS